MDVHVDPASLRAGRLERLQATMRAQGVDACLLFNDPNVRYATGASAMPIWSNTTFVRCALVPAAGRPILFEHPNSMHLFRAIEADVRPMHAWEFYDDTAAHAATFARETVDAMRELGVSSRLAVDRLGTPGFLALQREGIEILDSAPVTMRAREVKTPEEIALLELNGGIVMEMLARRRPRPRPGGCRTRSRGHPRGGPLAARRRAPGDEHRVLRPEHQPLAGRGDRPGPPGRATWSMSTPTRSASRATSSAYRARSCAAIAPPTPAQREAYHVAHDWLVALREMIRPGLTCLELAAKAPRLPSKFLPQRYEVMIHGIGLEEESPSVAYPGDAQPNGDRLLVENMALVVELYCGEVGASDGVKLGDQVLVAPGGVKVLVPYPWCDRLLR